MAIFNKEEIKFIRTNSYELGKIVVIMSGKLDCFIEENFKKMPIKKQIEFSNKVIKFFIDD